MMAAGQQRTRPAGASAGALRPGRSRSHAPRFRARVRVAHGDPGRRRSPQLDRLPGTGAGRTPRPRPPFFSRLAAAAPPAPSSKPLFRGGASTDGNSTDRSPLTTAGGAPGAGRRTPGPRERLLGRPAHRRAAPLTRSAGRPPALLLQILVQALAVSLVAAWATVILAGVAIEPAVSRPRRLFLPPRPADGPPAQRITEAGSGILASAGRLVAVLATSMNLSPSRERLFRWKRSGAPGRFWRS